VLLWLAVAGVAALLKAYPAAFHVVQWLGAAYLIYLGLRMILAKPSQAKPSQAKPGAAPTLEIKPRQYLWQTLVITVFNPKAIVFYMAFFPLFIDPQRHQGLITFGFMAVTIMALTFLYGLLIVLLTHFLAERMRANPRIARALEKLAGLCLVGFGVKLTLN
jgi:threonine/homoserine/homoserine lactone efflux protein